MINIENLISLNYISVKKLVLKGMAVLSASAALVACSHDSFFDENKAQENIKNEYKASFVQKYGEVDPNQTWDFTESMFDMETSASTRAKSTTTDVYALLSEWTEGYVHFQEISWLNPKWTKKVWNADTVYIAQNLKNCPELDWEPHISGCLKAWAYFSHGNGDTNAVRWYRLGVHTEDANGTQNTTVIKGKTKSNLWYTGYSQTVNGAGYIIDTRNLKNADKAYWYATVTNGNGSDNYEVTEAQKLTKYKEITAPSGSVYWCFSCDGNDDYTDLILLVKPVVICKRYMVEDLGSIGDFDFNDIVVDFNQISIVDEKTQKITYEKTAVVRAMGGKYDFTLKVGDKIVWGKKANGFTTTTMYNTQGTINYNEVYGESFEVNDWDPSENNISIVVGAGKNNGVYTVTFPEQGEAPMIIAVDPTRKWMNEYQSVPTDWWYDPAKQ